MTRRIKIGTAILCGVVLSGAAAVAITLIPFRASADERHRAMPSDLLVNDAMYVETQAITIRAPPQKVWPWLAQMGSGRAGWYSYDRIDNGGRPSANSVLQQYQQIAPGDVFPSIPGATDSFIVAAVQPPRDLVLIVPAALGPRVSWEFLLEPQDGGTRLLVRGRVSHHWLDGGQNPPPAPSGPIFIQRVYSMLARLPRPLLFGAGGFGHRVMLNRQLRGIRRRAEAGHP